MAKQTFTTGQILTAAQMTSLQQTAMGGGSTTAKTVSYTLVAADAGTVVQMNSASATTITVNTGLFAAGDTVQIQNVGAGVCTVTAGTATVSTSATLALKQYDAGSLYFNTTSAAIFFAVDAADGMTNPFTTTGDTVYASSGTTPTRLGIGSTGQVLTVASGIPSWATPATAASGLTLIKRATTTGAVNTGTTFDSVFTSTYKTYLINIEGWYAATGSDVPKIQLRVAGSTTATSYYGVAQNIDRSGSIAYNSTVNQASLQMGAAGTLDSAGPAQYAIYANRVGNSSQKASLYFTGVGAGNQCFINGTLFNDGAQTYDGFLLSAASNITVTVAVYGLATA